MSGKFRPPKRKRGAPYGKPIPFLVSLSSISSNVRSERFSGHVCGKVVMIMDTNHAREIYNKGYFGHWIDPSDRTAVNDWMTSSVPSEDVPQLVHKSPMVDEDENEVIVVSDSDSVSEDESKPGVSQPETEATRCQLCLTLEEAFFLAYALGCLSVFKDKKLTVDELWKLCCDVEPAFVLRYVVYHYYRSKGWVTRQGYAYGCDYLLYKYGPPYYHASYSVLVQLGRKMHLLSSEQLESIQKLTWMNLNALNRITEHVGKELLITYVNLSEQLTFDDLRLPSCIERCTVTEMLFHRRVIAKERDAKQ